jgi:hypothetical protein
VSLQSQRGSNGQVRCHKASVACRQEPPARRLGHSPIKIPNRATLCGVHSVPLTTILTTVPILNSVTDKHVCTDAPWNRGHRCRPRTSVDASKQAHYELLNRCRGNSRPWVRIPPLPPRLPTRNPDVFRVFSLPTHSLWSRPFLPYWRQIAPLFGITAALARPILAIPTVVFHYTARVGHEAIDHPALPSLPPLLSVRRRRPPSLSWRIGENSS